MAVVCGLWMVLNKFCYQAQQIIVVVKVGSLDPFKLHKYTYSVL